MLRNAFLTAVFISSAACMQAQWQMLDSHTTTDFRGVSNVGSGVVWISGTNGTVLRSEDGGYLWQHCAMPAGAEKLDFRGVQASDANTAVIMSSGKGESSRIYRTADGCQTWKEVFRNPDAEGFFDAILKVTEKQLFVVGDPVGGKFAMFTSRDGGLTWFVVDEPGLEAGKGAGAFAASNSSLGHVGPFLFFGTGGPEAKMYVAGMHCEKGSGMCDTVWQSRETPLAHGSASTGIFSVGGRMITDQAGRSTELLVAVGGTYDKAADSNGTAAFSKDGGSTWVSANTAPGGYRSAIAYFRDKSIWIAVGPNGTDVSTDDGRNWRALKPGPNDAPDADAKWNALSLPYAVGPKGRVGVLRDEALRSEHK